MVDASVREMFERSVSGCKGGVVSLQRRTEELKEERKTVEGQMDMARNELKKTQDLLKMLSDSKTVAPHHSSTQRHACSYVVINSVFVPTRASSQASTCRPLR